MLIRAWSSDVCSSDLKMTAPMRARSLVSIGSVVEHARVARLIAGGSRQEAAEPFAALGFDGRLARRVQRLRPALRGEQRRQFRELLRLQCEKLVARLRRLKRAGRGQIGRAHV